RGYEVSGLAKASVRRRYKGVSNFQRSRMESLARWPLPYRVSFRAQAARRHGVRVRKRLPGPLPGMCLRETHEGTCKRRMRGLARAAWGNGYATEALTVIVDIAKGLGVVRLYALCHPDHPASARVLEKCGFRLEQRLEQFAEFPNLNPGCREACLRYVRGEGA